MNIFFFRASKRDLMSKSSVSSSSASPIITKVEPSKIIEPALPLSVSTFAPINSSPITNGIAKPTPVITQPIIAPTEHINIASTPTPAIAVTQDDDPYDFHIPPPIITQQTPLPITTTQPIFPNNQNISPTNKTVSTQKSKSQVDSGDDPFDFSNQIKTLGISVPPKLAGKQSQTIQKDEQELHNIRGDPSLIPLAQVGQSNGAVYQSPQAAYQHISRTPYQQTPPPPQLQPQQQQQQHVSPVLQASVLNQPFVPSPTVAPQVTTQPVLLDPFGFPIASDGTIGTTIYRPPVKSFTAPIPSPSIEYNSLPRAADPVPVTTTPIKATAPVPITPTTPNSPGADVDPFGIFDMTKPKPVAAVIATPQAIPVDRSDAAYPIATVAAVVSAEPEVDEDDDPFKPGPSANFNKPLTRAVSDDDDPFSPGYRPVDPFQSRPQQLHQQQHAKQSILSPHNPTPSNTNNKRSNTNTSTSQQPSTNKANKKVALKKPTDTVDLLDFGDSPRTPGIGNSQVQSADVMSQFKQTYGLQHTDSSDIAGKTTHSFTADLTLT